MEYAPAGILRDRDRVTLEITAAIFMGFRNDSETMTASKLTQLTNMLSRLGMTPSDASHVPAPESDEPNEFAED